MADATFYFPHGFLWGTATSSHQVEGNNTRNQWWDWEQKPGNILNGDISGAACDWWNGRWREDLDRAVETGQNAHRLSIEWSRIQPEPDTWDEESLDRYLEIMRGLNERNLTPLVCLHHFSLPVWLSEMGGWENEKAAYYFEKYVRKTVETLKDYVTYWLTVNEPNVYAFSSYLIGDFPPGKKNLTLALQVMGNLLRGHAAAYHAIHDIQPAARVSFSHHFRGAYPHRRWSPLDQFLAFSMHELFNQAFPRALQTGVFRTILASQRIPQAKDTLDFFSLNYYTRDRVGFNLTRPGFIQRGFRHGSLLSKNGYIANEPAGMNEALAWAHKFGKPVLITENGIEDPDDTLRPRYLLEHLHQVWRAVNSNIPVKGYFHWTLVDNFEWERGWTQRFGLWALDPETQARIKRPSADLYAEIIQKNGISSEMVARFAPEIFNQLFPN